jgi:hypothetical protein
MKKYQSIKKILYKAHITPNKLKIISKDLKKI